VRAREPTKGTEIAALEAQRNEAEVRAEGNLLGERRAAIARLAMIAMFGVVTELDSAHRNSTNAIVGGIYTLLAIATLVVLHRIKRAEPRKALVGPMIVTVGDFSMITTMALLDASAKGAFSPGQHAIATTIIMTFAVSRYSVWHVVASVVCALASYAICASYSGELATHISIFVMGGFLVLGFMLAMTNAALKRMFHGLRQRDNLTRFLPRQVAERVIAVGPAALAPVEREVTVLFSDIRGFTTMSEGLSPRDVLAMLDDYFGRMSQIVKGHDGVVGKFLGDGMLAFWGVPDRLEDHAQRAVRAARDMRRAVRELNQWREQQQLPPIRIGIGIHTGPVAAGMLGGALQSEYTIIGDAVNVASRIEGLTKDHGVDVLVSETTWMQLAEPRRGDKLASAEIRGRKEPVVVYTIDSSAATIEVVGA
jgi:adenylate cyclase